MKPAICRTVTVLLFVHLFSIDIGIIHLLLAMCVLCMLRISSQPRQADKTLQKLFSFFSKTNVLDSDEALRKTTCRNR